MHDERRGGATRYKVSLVVKGRIPATPIEATLLNISTTGCMVDSLDASEVEEHATVLLTISPSIELSGQVAWRKGSAFGVAFHKPITKEVLAEIRRTSGQHARQRGLQDGFGRDLPALVSLRRQRGEVVEDA